MADGELEAQVLRLVGREPAPHPAEAMFESMLDGWRSQQLARGLSFATIEARARAVRRFHEHSEQWPWWWTPAMAEDWLAELRGIHKVSHSTVRGLQSAVRQFCWFITDPHYTWAADCERAFGTHPVQVLGDFNSAVHTSEVESRPGKRAFTLDELQAFFDHADDQVTRARQLGRKGWLRAFRDAVIFKTAYAWGLRRNEVRMLDVVDFGVNPKAPEFGRYGVCYVRHGKAMRGSPPKRRGVLTVWDWSAEVVEEWVSSIRCHFPTADGAAMFPSERAARVDLSAMNRTFAAYRRALDLDPALDFHSLRRSYVSHLVEGGFDALFVQQQVGHEHASTTSLYTFVSADYRTRTLREALDKTLARALDTAELDAEGDA